MNTLSQSVHLYLYLALLSSFFKLCWNNFASSLLDTGTDGASCCDVDDAAADGDDTTDARSLTDRDANGDADTGDDA